MARNTVFFHHPDGVETNRTDLMGRHTAGEGFLRGFVNYGDIDEYHAHTMSPDHFADFARRIRQFAGSSQPCRRVGHGMIGQHDVPGVLSYPGPDLAPLAWRRRTHGNAAYSLCGVNHTVSSERIMGRLGALLTAPVQPWDALICTSHSSKSAIRHVMDGYADYLEERIGARPPVELLMPVIPLGVDCAAFAQDARASADRAQLRQGLGIDTDDVALLFVGRLSFHAKAHPLPFYMAAEAAARHTGRRVHLIQAGWFASDGVEKEFRDGARALCPTVNTIFLDGRDDDVRRRIWRAADVFVSLSDNIQETFGLTPIEAMAAGLPVIVSDWNGYRETVRDGVDGFTIPTWMPAGGEGRDIAFAPELDLLGSTDDIAYDRYCGTVSQSTAVDTGACIDALSVLCGDANKRHVMGEAGRNHARDSFEWSVVVKAYQDVWDELDSRRARAAKETRHLHPVPDIPLRCDPFAMFGAYPTSVISDTTELRLVDGADMQGLDNRLSMHMNNFGAKYLLDRDGMEQVIGILTERGVVSVRDLVDVFDTGHRSQVLLSIGWLAKMYLVHLSSGVGAALDPDGSDFAENSLPQAESGEFDDALDMIERRNVSWVPVGEATNQTATSELLDRLADISVLELMERATVARSEGDVAMAAACLHRASALVPDDPDINIQMGELLASGERYDAAIACFRRAVQGYPDNLKAHRNLGKALFLRGDEAEGIHSFRRAVRLAPEDGEARLLLGTALRRAGAVNEALQCLRIAMEIEPERAEAGYHLGLVCRSMDRVDDARVTFERVLSSDPTNRFVQAAIMSMEAEAGGRAFSDQRYGRKIALHMSHQADYFALLPIFHALSEDHWPLFSADAREISEFRPDAILTTAERLNGLRDQMPACSVVQIPSAAIRRPDSIVHGTSADAVGVVTEDEQKAFLAAGLSQPNVWLTGLPLMDPVFNGEVHRQRRSGPERDGRKQVLYMPDWRREISAAPTMKEALSTLCNAKDGALDIMIRPDPVTLESQPGWIDGWMDFGASCENLTVHVAAGVDYLSLMADADLLLSDFSISAYTFLAFDAPLVLIRPAEDAPQRYCVSKSHAELLESVASCADGVADVVAQVLKSLDGTDSCDESRARMRSGVFGVGADGRAAGRTVSALRGFLDG